jgi:glycopeptide antibiotics resistance protein
MKALRVGKGVQALCLSVYTAAILVVTLVFHGGSGVRTNLAPFEDVERLALRARHGGILSSRFLYDVLGIAGNLLLFAPWAFLAWKYLDGPERRTLRNHVDVLLFGLLFSLGIEAVQSVLPTRAADVNDVFWNILGTGTGAVLAHVGRQVRIEWE